MAAAQAQLDTVTGLRRERYEFLLELIDLGMTRWAGDLEALLTLALRLPSEPVELGALELSDWVLIRTLMISNRGTAELWTGDLAAARVHLTEAARPEPSGVVALPNLNARAHLAYLHWTNGELEAAEATGRDALDGLVQMGIPGAVQARCAYLALAGTAIDRDDLTAGAGWLRAAEDSASEPHTAYAAELMAARLEAAEGRIFEAVAAVRDARERHQDDPFPPSLVAQSHLLEAQFLALAGNRRTAQQAMDGVAVPGDLIPPEGCSIRARVDRHLAAVAEALIDEQCDTALDELESALVAAAPERLRQRFVALAGILNPLLSARIERGTREPDFAADLLGRTADQAQRAGDDLHAVFVPLTARETNILRYLATTLTTKEIAEALYVSVNTVKTHQRSIHQKLGARDRREAVTHARELGLL